MAWTTTYTAVTWTTGDTITETKLDNMVANDQAYDSHAAEGLLLNNNVAFSGKDTGGTRHDLIKINASDEIEIGETDDVVKMGGVQISPASYSIVIPIYTPKSNINWSTIQDSPDDADGNKAYGGLWLQSSSAQNDEVAWDIPLVPGTWTFGMFHARSSDRGIYSLQFDDVEKGTIDGYSSTSDFDTFSTITGITVSTPGIVEVKLKMTTKNASSSNYYGCISWAALVRTGT